MGQTWHAPAGAPRPAHRMGLYLRRDLSREGEGCRAGHALVRHRRHGGAPHRDQCRRRSRRPCGADRRSGRLALDAQAGDPRQHHRPGAAATIARVEPGGECLAIHARQLVVEPDLQILRRHRRAVLPSLEQPHRPTMEDHVPRHAQMGAWVLINDRWYYSGFCLYDEEFPIIYVNNTTAKTRQIFTLFHELAHLLFHTSGVDTQGDGFVNELAGDNQRIEVICNRMTACLLVPEETFDAAFAGQAPTEATATELAQLFSVSREFVFRKFLDRDLITAADYDQAARRWADQGQRGSGGDHYNTKIAYLGTEYINLAFQRFYQNRIDYNQLADILDTKPKNLTWLEEYVSRKAP